MFENVSVFHWVTEVEYELRIHRSHHPFSLTLTQSHTSEPTSRLCARCSRGTRSSRDGSMRCGAFWRSLNHSKNSLCCISPRLDFSRRSTLPRYDPHRHLSHGPPLEGTSEGGSAGRVREDPQRGAPADDPIPRLVLSRGALAAYHQDLLAGCSLPLPTISHPSRRTDPSRLATRSLPLRQWFTEIARRTLRS
jgi:hypothetical protein